mgnify:CR=1 FL=1
MRRENAPTASATIGISTKAIIVSCQFRYSSQPNRPRITQVSRTMITSTEASDCVTFCTSLTSRAMMVPAEWVEK